MREPGLEIKGNSQHCLCTFSANVQFFPKYKASFERKVKDRGIAQTHRRNLTEE
jgi:hypothetical protein